MSTKKKLKAMKNSKYDNIALTRDEIDILYNKLDEVNFNKLIDILSNDEFYSLKMIKSEMSIYNLIIGERSNGKTVSVLIEMLLNWIIHGKQGAYIRRYDTELTGGNAKQVYTTIVDDLDLVNILTNGEYTDIYYRGGEWYLYYYDFETNTRVTQNTPFVYAFSINTAEAKKGTTYTDITTVLFDEFLSRNRYIINEFVEFQNLISTIKRRRTDLRIYMLGNPVTQYSPYFDEMGIKDIRNMEQGTIQTYDYGEGGPTLSIEYVAESESNVESDRYFAFDNPRLRMITSGAWELPMYPHAPFKIKPDDILESFFLEFKEDLIQGDIVYKDESLFIYFHERTYDIEEDDERMQYRLEHSPYWNHGISLTSRHRNKLSAKIGELVSKELVFYQDNRIGELVRNYRMESEAYTIMNF